jgi:hypothetical protein
MGAEQVEGRRQQLRPTGPTGTSGGDPDGSRAEPGIFPPPPPQEMPLLQRKSFGVSATPPLRQ